MKNLAAVAAAALIAVGFATAPASAAVTVPGSVTVKWNVQVNATLALTTNYTNTGINTTTNSVIDVKNNGGVGTCAGPAAGANVNGTVDFGNVTADTAAVTFCGYENAVVAKVGTNSSSWNMSEAATVPAGYVLCPVGNGITFANATAPTTSTLTAANAFSATNQASGFGTTVACTATSLGGTGGLVTAPTNIETGNFTTGSAAAYIGEGYVLGIPALAASGAQTLTVAYSLVAN